MTAPAVKLHLHEHVATLILNRPQKRNALSRTMLAELSQALDDLHQERRVRAVILSGAGPTYCAGLDLAEMLATQAQRDAARRWHEDVTAYQELLLQMLHFPKPLIAAVHGAALAGGAGLVLACDLAIGSQQAAFGLPEPRRGLVAGIAAPLLVFRIGAGYAGYLLTSSATIDAQECYRVGLLHELTSEDQLWPRARQLADQCALGAPESLQATKRMLHETIGEHLMTLLAAGAAASATARTTEAAAEGLRAFQEKRAPRWP